MMALRKSFWPRKGKSNMVSINGGTLIVDNQHFVFSNCLIAGTKSRGRDSLLRELVADALNDNKAVFVIQNGTALPQNSLKDEFSNGWGNRTFFEFDFCKHGFTRPINFFKGSSIDFVQELVLLLMTTYKDMSPETKSFVERYLVEVMTLYKLDSTTKKFSLSTIGEFDEQWLVDEATQLFAKGLIDDKQRDRTLKYAGNLVLYKKELYEYENFCIDIQKLDFAKILSGDLGYAQLNSASYVTFLTLDFISCAKQSTALLQLFIHKAIREMKSSKVKTSFFFEDIDLLTIPEFREFLKACQSSSGNNVFFTLDSIGSLGNSGFDPRPYCNTYFVFRQSIMSEAEEWAKTSGTYKKDKATQTTASYDQVYGERNSGFIGGIMNLLNRNKSVVTGVNHEIVDEYRILPEEFMNLSEYASKVIIGTTSGVPYLTEILWPQ